MLGKGDRHLWNGNGMDFDLNHDIEQINMRRGD